MQTLEHSSLDADDSASSGSLLTTTTRELNQVSAVRQCLAVTAGENFVATAQSFLPVDADNDGEVQLRVSFYPEADCGGAFIIYETSPLAGAEGTWTDHQVTVEAPANAVSALVLFDQYRRSGTSHTAYWDNVCLVAQ